MTCRSIASLLLLLIAPACASAPPVDRPARQSPLVVVLVVDQMRGDYLEMYGGAFTGGLKRLMTEGTWFRRGAYPYLNTVTCAGHATIGTGALPYRHGMVLNAWWDREAARSVPCTTDNLVQNIGYMGPTTGGDSASALRVAPLAEQLHDNTGGRSVALSLKPRSAIGLAGRNPNAVLWFNDRTGFATSSAFSDTPVPWVQAYIDAHPLEADRGKTWDRLLGADAYRGEDDGAGERTPGGWTRLFPHPVGEPAAAFLGQWQRTPLADEYLARMAAHAIDTLDLGRGPGTDFLGVSFSTLDLVGHQYGPASHEVQDVLFRLDRTIGTLLDHLDARLGREGYVLALSADHGVSPIPEQSGAGRQPASGIITAIDAALAPLFGPGKYVVHTAYTDVYLAPGVFDKIKASPQASTAVLAALRALPGISHAFRADEISDPAVRTHADPVRRAAALSYHAPRSGDLIVVPELNWLLSTAAATHGTQHPYDQRVPVIFFGAGVPAGIQNGPATPADIAPTLAALANARFKATDGTVLIGR